jgi:hypothetical protein
MKPTSQPGFGVRAKAQLAVERAFGQVTAASMQVMNAVRGVARPRADAESLADHSSFREHREAAVQALPHDFKVLIHEGELDHIAGWVLKDAHQETGGDLSGFWTNTRSPSVQFVLGPGPKARHEVAAFYQDVDYLRLAQGIGRTAHGLQHIGEWHSHHRLGLAQPSGGDANTIAKVFQQFPVNEFLLCIATIGQAGNAADLDIGHNDVRVGAFLFRRGVQGYQRGGWVVLPGSSPVAERVREQGGLRGADQPIRAWRVLRVSLEQPVGQANPAPEGWYTQPDGTRFLRAFDRLCRTELDDCEMSVDKGVMAYAFRSEGSAWEVRFPVRFPTDPAELTGAQDGPRRWLRCELGDPTEAAQTLFAEVCTVVSAEGAPPAQDVPDPAATICATATVPARSTHLAPSALLATPARPEPKAEAQRLHLTVDRASTIDAVQCQRTENAQHREIGIPATPAGSEADRRKGMDH